MVSLGSLWLPILVSAVLVFLVSAIIHMVLKYHNKDYFKLPNEDAVRAAIRSGNPPPGQYVIPYCSDMKEMEKPEMKQKYVDGPVAVINLLRPGVPKMSKNLIQWFLFILVVSFFIAYVTAHCLPRGAEYLRVFQIAGAVGYVAYGLGGLPAAIWMGKPWRVALKEQVDGLVYGLVTAGTFGWLWPNVG
jgi:hypothetical protein